MMNTMRFSRFLMVSLVTFLLALAPVTTVFAGGGPSRVGLWLTPLAGTTQGANLTFSFIDPVGDSTGSIDVTEMMVIYNNATGNYTITLTATAANPFVGLFRVNINLYNPDTATGSSYFEDSLNDFNLAAATTSLKLTGTNTNLLAWKAGDRVATNTLAGLGNPPGASFFRSSVSNFPIGFLTNEDAIAYGPAGVATIHPLTPQDAIELLMDDVEALLEAGTLTQDQAAGLMDKLEAAIASLDRGNATAACNQLQAFINQANAFINANILSLGEGQTLIDTTEEIRDQIGC
jgi:hypothetical protein